MRIRRLYLLVITAVLLTACDQGRVNRGPDYYKTLTYRGIDSAAGGIKFFVVGDWGRQGNDEQMLVAGAMTDVAYRLNPSFIISTGDNFYENGVESTKDPLWQSSFEQVYNFQNLQKPWYVVLGNHDYRGNPMAEIGYSKISARWMMPSRYYAIEKEISDSGNCRLLMVFVDTSPFESEYYEDHRHKDLAQQDTIAQKVWLDSVLSHSTAKWKIVIGHHPIYTSGNRLGVDSNMLYTLQPIFDKYGIDAYFSGHEHDLQVHKPGGSYTCHFVSGAGSQARPLKGKLPSTLFAKAVPGFMSVKVTNEKIEVQVINERREALFTETIKKIVRRPPLAHFKMKREIGQWVRL